MPIAGMTDEKKPAGSGIPVAIRLYKGSPKNKQGHMGRDLDHFRVEIEPAFQGRGLETLITDIFGPNPTRFEPCYLANPTANEAFDTWKVAFNASNAMTRKCTGDGDCGLVGMRHPSTGTWIENTGGLPCLCRQEKAAAEAAGKLGKYKPTCQNSGRLNLIFPQLTSHIGLAYVHMNLKSDHEIRRIYQYLCDIEGIVGNLTLVPFVLGRATEPMNVPNPNKTGSRMKVNKSLVYLHVTAEGAQRVLLPAIESGMRYESPALPEPERISDRIGFTTEQARETFGNGGSRRIDREPDAPTGESWTPIDRLMVEIDEEGNYLYRLVMRDGNTIWYDQSTEVFEVAGVEGANRWDYPNTVEFEPPLMVQWEERLGERWLTVIADYEGDVVVDLGETNPNPFM